MAASKVETGLVSRLERLKGDEPECCVPDYVDRSREIRKTPRFASALARARAMSDEKRLVAAALLRRHLEMCACEIQAALGLTHATVSHHMRVLGEAGLVTAERRGKWMYYRLNPGAAREIP